MSASDHLRRITDDRLARSLTPHHDAAVIGLDDFKQKLAHRVILPGEAGARARLQLEIITPAQLAIAKELDGGLSEGVVATLLVEAMASLLCSHAMKFVHDRPADKDWLIEEMLRMLSAKAKKLLREVDTLPADQVAGVLAPRPITPGRG